MELVAAILLWAAHGSITSASSLHNNNKFDIRALSSSPSGNYSPAIIPCPSTRPTIRGAASGLNPSERDWLAKRRAATVQPMKDFMSRANIEGFDAESYLDKYANDVANLPNVGIAVSGGGYRALMNGAGVLNGMDSRANGSTDAGGLGGLLQSATYLAGLSGGGWLVGSLYANNFTSVQGIMEGTSVWQFEDNIFTGPDSGVVSTVEYWTDIYDQVNDKKDTGFQTSVTDYWGRALSYQLVGAPAGGPSLTWSSLAQDSNFSNGDYPIPILVADGRAPNTVIVSLNATNYELGPWEIGSFDPALYGFVPTQYVGSDFSAGSVPSDGNCVEGFDNVGFVFGTSSTLFNQFLLTNITAATGVPSFVGDALQSLVSMVGDDNNDIADWTPNPFMGFNPSTNPTANSNNLSLVDGGEDLQNIPFNPLLQPIRAVDVIYAIDSSADTTTNWPNGTALRATYERSLVPEIANGTLFPAVPDDNTFINLGLNNRPTFFGCNASNFTLATGQAPPPLIVYLPNAPYTNHSNVSTFDPSYTITERNDYISNGIFASSQGSGSLDAEWPACVACAALSRSLTRTGTAVPSGCSSCFDRYCWNGTLDTTKASVYEPNLKVGSGGNSAGGTGAGGTGAGGTSNSAGVRIGVQRAWEFALGSFGLVMLSVLL